MKSFDLALLIGAASATWSEKQITFLSAGTCGTGPKAFQNIEIFRVKGNWYPLWVDIEGLQDTGFNAGCFKQKIGEPEK